MVFVFFFLVWFDFYFYYESVGKNIVFKDVFKNDFKRFDKFICKIIFFVDILSGSNGIDIIFDFSKNFIIEEIFDKFVKFVEEVGVEKKCDVMFVGEKINFIEGCVVYYVVLCNVSNQVMKVDGVDVMNVKGGVNDVFEYMCVFFE